MFSHLFHRGTRRSLLIEIGPYQLLAAGITRPDRGPAVINCAAEFDPEDDAGLRRWLETKLDWQKARTEIICGLVPDRRLLQRETLQPRRLTEPDYLSTLLREEYRIENPDAWNIEILNPLEGTALTPEGAARPGLICGVADASVQKVQQRLLEHRLAPTRLEASLPSLFGAIFAQLAAQGDKRAAVVVLIEKDQTVAYILGKEGVHTPIPVRQGFQSLVSLARKEFNLAGDAEAQARLRHPDDELRKAAPKLLRTLGRDLKPLIDSYEMATGQPAGAIYCAYLPPSLAWIQEPLAKVVERPPLAIDCAQWLPAAGLRADEGVTFGPQWLGALSLIAEPATPSADEMHEAPSEVPWRMDCRVATDQPNDRIVGREFLTGAVAVALAALAITITIWQLYVSNSLRADTLYWETEMAKNQKLFEELTSTARQLQTQSGRLDAAYTLMAAPYQVSDFVMNLGRTLPPNMRIDRIESSRGRIALSGGLREPSETASGTLNRYLEELRRSATIGPLFSSIGLTSLQRETDQDSMAFEITFRVKPLQP
jgi:hypothetical protein